MEEARLECLPADVKFLKMDINFDLNKERECFACFYDLHLSAAGCECSIDKYSCLGHSKLFCSCGIDKRFVLLRYTINELNKLVEALEGESDAIEEWANMNSSIVSVDAGDVCIDKPDVDRDMCKVKVYEVESLSRCAGTKKSKLNERSSTCSHVSSELVQSDSQVESAPRGTADSHNDNINDENSVMDNEVKVEQKCSVDLNFDVMSGQYESHKDKGIGCVEKVWYSDATKEQDNMVLDGVGNLSDFFALVKKDYPSCSRDARDSGNFEGSKLFGVDLPMHLSMRVLPSSEFKMEAMDTFNTSMPLTNQSFLFQKFATSIEPISLGSVVFRKLWCSKHTIYPKGMLQCYFLPLDYTICIFVDIFGGLFFFLLLVNF